MCGVLDQAKARLKIFVKATAGKKKSLDKPQNFLSVSEDYRIFFAFENKTYCIG